MVNNTLNLPLGLRLTSRNLGYHNQALRCAKTVEPSLTTQIDNLLKQYFDLDLQAPQPLTERLLVTDHWVSFGKLLPYSLPFYLSSRAQSHAELGTEQLMQLELARIIVLQGLKTDFQNLFLYHQLLAHLDSLLTPSPPSPPHTELAQLQQIAAQLRLAIQELQPARTQGVQVKSLMSKHAKTKFFRNIHASLAKLKKQLA